MSDRERMALVSAQRAVVTEVLDDCELQLKELSVAIMSIVNLGYPQMPKDTLDSLKRISRAMSQKIPR